MYLGETWSVPAILLDGSALTGIVVAVGAVCSKFDKMFTGDAPAMHCRCNVHPVAVWDGFSAQVFTFQFTNAFVEIEPNLFIARILDAPLSYFVAPAARC